MQFSPLSKVWIYLSSREFSVEESSKLNQQLTEFCSKWAAHGNNLKAKGDVLHRRFIFLMVDETQAGASGCSIDTSVHFIQEIEREYRTNLFDRLLFARKENNNVLISHARELESLVASGNLDEDTIIFNTAITIKKEFDEKFELPLSKSWLMKKVSKYREESKF